MKFQSDMNSNWTVYKCVFSSIPLRFENHQIASMFLRYPFVFFVLLIFRVNIILFETIASFVYSLLLKTEMLSVELNMMTIVVDDWRYNTYILKNRTGNGVDVNINHMNGGSNLNQNNDFRLHNLNSKAFFLSFINFLLLFFFLILLM